jgi:hypothetical protein
MFANIKKLYYNSKFYFTPKAIKRPVKSIKISNDCKIYIFRKKIIECEYTEGY